MGSSPFLWRSGFDLFLVTTKCSMHTTCVVCKNIACKYLGLVNLVKNNAKYTHFHGYARI